MRFSPGKMAAQAAWYRERGDIATAERLEARLKVVGRCKRCGRGLTDPRSVLRGIGPECWQKEPAALFDDDDDELDAAKARHPARPVENIESDAL